MRIERGFTLMELLVTLAVAGVLMTIAVPNFRTLIQNSRLTTEINTMVGTLTVARSKAVELGGNTVVSVCPGTVSTSGTVTCGGSSTWANGWVVYSATYSSSGCTTGTKTAIRAYPALPAGNTLTAGSTASITFLSSGLLCGAAAAMDFIFCDSRLASYGRVVNLAITGRAQASSTVGEKIDGTALTSC
ncbi:MAG TPA: GspH/FimT family pseudopilin [Gammaproteobacteria bacterium]|nr:GspH/FimT family pseudopilin [Gammaproteobacteria bacterium]